MEKFTLTTLLSKELLLEYYQNPNHRSAVTRKAKKNLSSDEYNNYKNLKKYITIISINVSDDITAEKFYDIIYHNIFLQHENQIHKDALNTYLIELVLNTLNKVATKYNISWEDRHINFPKIFWIKLVRDIVPKVPNHSEEFINKYSWQLVLGICKGHSKEIENALLKGKIKDMNHLSWFILKIIQDNIVTSYFEIISKAKQKQKIERLAEQEEKIREICDSDNDSPRHDFQNTTKPFVPMFDYSELFE